VYTPLSLMTVNCDAITNVFIDCQMWKKREVLKDVADATALNWHINTKGGIEKRCSCNRNAP